MAENTGVVAKRLTNEQRQSAALLFYLPAAETPDGERFQRVLDINSDLSDCTRPYWTLADAIIHAFERERPDPAWLPWIKAGNLVLTPEDIQSLYREAAQARSHVPGTPPKRS